VEVITTTKLISLIDNSLSILCMYDNGVILLDVGGILRKFEAY